MKNNVSSLTLKFSALAGVAVSASTTAQAAIVQSTTVGTGLTPPATLGSADWDVDADGTVDFRLFNGTELGATVAPPQAFFDGLNGGQWVGHRDPELGSINRPIQRFSAGFTVDSSMPGYGFAAAAGNMTFIGMIPEVSGWVLNEPGNFAFKFTRGADTLYGWGTLKFTGTPQGQGYTILSAYYENTPDGAIVIGATSAIPEPASAAALLGLGAAGVAAWRRRRPVAA